MKSNGSGFERKWYKSLMKQPGVSKQASEAEARPELVRAGATAEHPAPRWHLSLVWSQLAVDAAPVPHADAVRRGINFANNGLPQRAIEEFDRAISLKPDYGLAYCRLALMFMDSNQPDEALATYKRLLDHVCEATQPVADALLNTGFILGELGRREEAITVYDDLLNRFNRTRIPELRIRLAEALFNKAHMLRELDSHAEALTVLNELLVRFNARIHRKGHPPPEIAVAYSSGIYSKGLTLCALGRSHDAIKLFEDLFFEWEARSFDPLLREPLGPALKDVGLIVDAPGRTPMAIVAYAIVAGRFRNSPDIPPLNWERDRTGAIEAQLVADALFNKANALELLPSAVADYDDIINYLDDEVATPELQYATAKSLYNKGVVLGEVDGTESEIQAYDELINRFRLADERALRRVVAKALYNKGRALRANSRHQKAFDAFTECERFVRHANDVVVLRDNINSLRVYIPLNTFSLGLYTGEGDGPGPSKAQDLSGTIMDDDAAIDLNAAADERGVSRSDVLKLIERQAAETGQETTRRISPNEAAEADARLLAGELPASLQPRSQVRQVKPPPDAATIDRADEVLAAYALGKREGRTFTASEMAFVRASWRIKEAVKPKAPAKRRGRPKALRTVIST